MQDLTKFNDFFIDKEEDFIIQMGLLQDKLGNEKDPQALRRIRRSFMDVHGRPQPPLVRDLKFIPNKNAHRPYNSSRPWSHFTILAVSWGMC